MPSATPNSAKPRPSGAVKPQRSVQSAELGGRLLLILAAQPAAMTLKDLAAHAAIPASRVHPYLVSLVKLQLVNQDPQTGRYALGAGALQLGLACLTQLDAMKIAQPIAEDLAQSTGHAVALSLWGNMGPTIVRYLESSQPLHVSMRAGSVMSIFGTATGRAFAAVLPLTALQQSLHAPLGDSAMTKSTSKRQLEASRQEAVQEYAGHGVTRAIGRPIPGVNAFSAPAFGHDGQAAMVITALGHEDNFSSEWRSPVANAVRSAAQALSVGLGYRAAAQQPL